MNLSDYIDLLPDVYDKSSAPKSRIRKLFEVTADALQILIDTATENKLIKDLFHASGDVLDAIGEDYGLPRYGMNDDDYRALILAKIFARISGNNDDKIINYFRFFTSLPINVVRLTEDSIRIPKLLGLYVWRAFSVEIPGLSPTLRSRLLPALQILKPAGVYGTINFSQVFNPATDLPGAGYSQITTAGESWQSAQNDGDNVLLTVGKIAPGDDAQVMRDRFTTDYNIVGNFLGSSTTLRDEIFRFPGEVVYNAWDVLLRVTTTALTRILPDGLASSSTFLHYEPGLMFGVGLYEGAPAQNSRVFRSTDGGVTWSRVILANNNIYPPRTQYIKAGTAYIVSLWTTDNELVFMRSTNNGATWTETVALTGTSMFVRKLAKSADNNTILAVAANATNTRLYRSTNNGVSWTSQTFAALGIPNTVFPRVYYLGGSSFIIVSEPNGYRSNDNGLSWALDPIPSGLANTITSGAGALWLYGNKTLYRYTGADSAPVPYYTERNAATDTIDDPVYVKIPTWGQYPEVFDDGTGRLWITSAAPTPSLSNLPIAVCILTSPQFPDKMATYYITKPLANRLMTVISDRIVGLFGTGPTGLYGNLIVSSPLSNNRVGLARFNRQTQSLTKITLPPIAFSRCVRYAGKLVLASVRYDGLVLYSTDEGVTWRECKFTGAYRPTRVHTLVEFQGKLVAVCHEYRAADTNYTRTYIFDSNDGQNFVYRTTANGTPGIEGGWRRYRTAADTQYLYLSNGLRYNGASLVAHNHPIPCLGLSVQGGIVYALSGDTSTNELKLYASTDHGNTYTLISTTAGFKSVLGMNQMGIIIALGPTSVVSYDKATWQNSNLPNQIWEDVAASIGAFVVVSETEVTNNLQISRMVLP